MSPLKQHFRKWEGEAKYAVEQAIEALPPSLQHAAASIPICLIPDPDPSLAEPDWEPGWEEEILGLFIGKALNEPDDLVDSPPQIILFIHNLVSFSENDTRVFRREVRKTFYHELGHFLGLDEYDLLLRNLD